MKPLYHFLAVFFAMLLLCFPLTGCEEKNSVKESTYTEDSRTVYGSGEEDRNNTVNTSETDSDLTGIHMDKDGSYTTKEDVMNYLIEYQTLPSNFITKKEARKLGWSGGSLEPYAPGKCIGGDTFGNYEGVLPEDSKVTYHECDIDTLGAQSRGSKRIVYSDDGRIYYTGDHYASFTLLYGGEE